MYPLRFVSSPGVVAGTIGLAIVPTATTYFKLPPNRVVELGTQTVL
jgi:hypothetical protein